MRFEKLPGVKYRATKKVTRMEYDAFNKVFLPRDYREWHEWDANVIHREELAHMVADQGMRQFKHLSEVPENWPELLTLRGAAEGHVDTRMTLRMAVRADFIASHFDYCTARWDENRDIFENDCIENRDSADIRVPDALTKYIADVQRLARKELLKRRGERDAYEASAAGKLEIALDALRPRMEKATSPVTAKALERAIRAAIAVAIEESTTGEEK